MEQQGIDHAQQSARSLLKRLLRFVFGTVVIYLFAGLFILAVRLTWPSESYTASIEFILSIDFGDAVAVLAVLATLTVAINVIVWTNVRGNAEAQRYAHGKLLEYPAFFIGQVALLVGFATVIGYAPSEIDLVRTVTVLVACGSIVVLSVHTIDGLETGLNVVREVRQAGASSEIRQLSRVLKRWPIVRAGISYRTQVRRDLANTSLQANVVLAIVLVLRALVYGELARLPIQLVVMLLVVAVVTCFVGITVTLIVTSFVTKQATAVVGFGFALVLFWTLAFVGTFSGASASEHSLVWAIALKCGLLVAFGWVPGRIVVGLVSGSSTTLPWSSARWYVRRSVLRELGRRRRLSDRTADRDAGKAGPLAIRLRNLAAWYRAATGEVDTDSRARAGLRYDGDRTAIP